MNNVGSLLVQKAYHQRSPGRSDRRMIFNAEQGNRFGDARYGKNTTAPKAIRDLTPRPAVVYRNSAADTEQHDGHHESPRTDCR
jgi:hypothetical protein